jgi:hypothetical protein
MKDFTEEQYVAAIPAHCSHQGMEEHASMMLCWGLAGAVREGRAMDCSGCDENVTTWTPEKQAQYAAFRQSLSREPK